MNFINGTRRQVAVAAFLLTVAGCGGGGADVPDQPQATNPESTTSAPSVSTGDSTTTEASLDESTTVPAPDPAEAPAVGEAGFFTVDGEEFVVTLLNRCIPFQDAEGNIDLQALSAAQVKLNLYVAGGTVEVSVDGSGLRETYGSVAFGEDPVVHESEVDGDRWMGSATVGDSLGSGSTVDLRWDVMVPSDVNDCSL